MKKRIVLLVLLLGMIFPGPAAADQSAWRFTVGYSFLNNAKEIKDAYKHILKQKADDKHVYYSNFGLSAQPYYQFENGLRIGAGAGPLVLLVGDASHIQLPINATIGYSFFADSAFSVYLRTGIAYHAATGDFYADSLPGFYGGIGCEIRNTNPVHFGFEAVYDGARIRLDRTPGSLHHEKITTGELTLFLYADF